MANKVFQSPSDECKPFEGAPVIMFGDFGQLGPIIKGEQAAVGKWVFDSSIFKNFS